MQYVLLCQLCARHCSRPGDAVNSYSPCSYREGRCTYSYDKNTEEMLMGERAKWLGVQKWENPLHGAP